MSGIISPAISALKAGLVWLANSVGPARGAAVAGAYRNTFSGEDGRRVLMDLARYCRFGTTSFVPGDPHQTAFNEGARDAFLHIVEIAGLSAADVAELIATDGQSIHIEQEPNI